MGTDIVCRGSLSRLRPNQDLVLIAQQSLPNTSKSNSTNRPNTSYSVGNFLFGSTAQHPFWYLVLDEIRRLARDRNVHRVETRFDVVGRTGPGMLSRAARRYFNAPKDMALSPVLLRSSVIKVYDMEMSFAVFANTSFYSRLFALSNRRHSALHRRQAVVFETGGCAHCYHYNFFGWGSSVKRSRESIKTLDPASSERIVLLKNARNSSVELHGAGFSFWKTQQRKRLAGKRRKRSYLEGGIRSWGVRTPS